MDYRLAMRQKPDRDPLLHKPDCECNGGEDSPVPIQAEDTDEEKKLCHGECYGGARAFVSDEIVTRS